MNKENHIRIKSKLQHELSASFEIDGVKHLVITEDAKPRIITQVYQGGQVIDSIKTDYTPILKTKNLSGKVRNMMEKQHNRTVQAFKKSMALTEEAPQTEAQPEPETPQKADIGEAEAQPRRKTSKLRTSAEYLSDVKRLFTRKNYKSAMALLDEALAKHPDDAFLLSYSGCLNAVVNKKYSAGIKTCKKALESLKKKIPFGAEFYLPTLYLNLGRAYLAAEKKKEAIEAFQKGLKMDPNNKDITWEMKKLGDRKPPPVAFLKRSNPINIYIGKMLHKMRK